MDTLAVIFAVGCALVFMAFAIMAWIVLAGVRLLLDWVRTGRFSWGALRKSNDT